MPLLDLMIKDGALLYWRPSEEAMAEPGTEPLQGWAESEWPYVWRVALPDDGMVRVNDLPILMMGGEPIDPILASAKAEAELARLAVERKVARGRERMRIVGRIAELTEELVMYEEMPDAVQPAQVVKRLERTDSHNAIALGRTATQELIRG